MKPVKKAAEMTPAELGRYIDQSVLKPEFTDEDIRKYIQEGIDYNCATVCINPSSLPIARGREAAGRCALQTRNDRFPRLAGRA